MKHIAYVVSTISLHKRSRRPACGSEARDGNGCVNHGGSDDGHQGGEKFRVRVEAFRNEVAGADIEKKPEKYRQHDAEETLRHCDEEGGENADAGGHSVSSAAAQRLALLPSVFQHDIHGVDAVGKIMRQNADG